MRGDAGGLVEIGPAQGGPGTIRVSFSAGKIIDIWIDDLRLAPKCVSYQGKIIEQGTHSELIARDGTYAKLWSRQSGGFLEPDLQEEAAE